MKFKSFLIYLKEQLLKIINMLDSSIILEESVNTLYTVLKVNIYTNPGELERYFTLTLNDPIRVDWGDGGELEEYEKGVNNLIHTYDTAEVYYDVVIYSYNESAISSLHAHQVISGGYTNVFYVEYAKKGLTSIITKSKNVINTKTKNMSENLTYLVMQDHDQVTGNLFNLPLHIMTHIDIESVPTNLHLNIEGDVWNPNLKYFRFGNPGFPGGYTDLILISMNDSLVSGATILFEGSTGTRTSSSDAAVTALELRGCTVTTN